MLGIIVWNEFKIHLGAFLQIISGAQQFLVPISKAEENWFWEERDQRASEKFKRV